MTIVHITYHDETNIGSCPIGQTGGFENADGNGEIHCFRIFDGVSVMLMQLEMGSYAERGFLQLKVLELMLLLGRIPQERAADPYCSAEQTALAHHLRDHLLTNREGYVSLAQLAAEHAISVSHLQKLFKQTYGMPVYHYIKEYRLEQAAVELVRSRKPITEIAQHAGYDNASKFSESFKKRYGKTPSRYRADKTNAVKRSIETKTE